MKVIQSVRAGMLALAIFSGGLTLAQPATQPANPQGRVFGNGAGGRTEIFLQRFRDATADLGLSDDQKSKLEAIFTKAGNDMRDLAPQLQGMDRQDRQQKFRELMMDVRDQIRGVLTDDQAQKLQEKLQTMRPPGGQGFGAAGAPPQPAQPPAAGNGAVANGGAANGGAANGQLAPRIQQTLKRLEDSLATLQLSDDQKKQVQSIVEDGKKQLTDLRDKVQAGTMKLEELRAQAPQIFAAMRDQLAGVLTQDQQEKLRDAIQSRFDQQQNATPAAMPPPATQPAMKMNMDEDKPSRLSDAAPAPAQQQQVHIATDAGPKIGSAIPELSLEELNGRNVQLSAFKGKPTVIEFGSYTSPSFRQRAAKMEELARQYGLRANFLIIYTKEAHATGGWEIDRNKDDGVRVAKHADLAARRAAAKDAKQALRINLIPIALDSMDDSAMNAFGAGENSAVVIGRDGKVAAKEAWCDTFRLRAALDDALASKAESTE